MVTINCTTEDHLELDQLTEFQGGLKNRTDGDYAKIIVSIQKYGFSFPFFVWSHDGINHVLDGHGRLGALKKLKDQGEVIPPLPVVYVDCGNEENAKNLLLRLNSQYGQMTAESVMDFMAGLEFDPYEISLPAGVLDLNIDPPVTVDDDEAPEPQLDAPAISRPGEIYQLGPHRLMCGDSTKEDDVAKLMAGEKADCVFSDPPYGMGLDTDFSSMKNKLEFAEGKNVKNGKKYAQGIVDDFTPAMIEMLLSLDAEETFLWGADYYAELLDGKNEGSWFVWDKRASADGDIGKDESADKMYGSCFELCWSKKKHKRDIARVKWAGIFGTEQEFDHRRYHPTQKPVRLVEWFLQRYTKKDDVVVDLFGGSGSTLIGCQKTKCKARVMELDPIYCDVIRRRWTTWCRENNLEPGEGALDEY